MKWFCLVCLLFFLGTALAACADFTVDIKVENQTPSDIRIIYSQLKQDGTPFFHGDSVYTSAVISAGQSGMVNSGIINGISVVPKIVFQAVDLSGNTVWQNTWTGSEFAKFAYSGHFHPVLTVSPQAN